MTSRYQEGYDQGHKKGMADCEDEIDRLRYEYVSTHAQLTRLNLENQRLRILADELGYADQMAKLEAEVDRVHAVIINLEDDYKAEIKRLRAENDQQRGVIAAYRDGSARRELEAEIERLRAQLSWIDSDQEQRAQAKIAKQKAEIERLRAAPEPKP